MMQARVTITMELGSRDEKGRSVKTIREYREANGLTQVQLAHEVGVTPSTVYKWEAGKVVPDVIRLRTLARLFEVGTDDIALIGVDVFPEDGLGKLAA